MHCTFKMYINVFSENVYTLKRHQILISTIEVKLTESKDKFSFVSLLTILPFQFYQVQDTYILMCHKFI